MFRQKLENHQLTVDKKVWADIEARMKPQRKKLVWLWIPISSAAVLALLFTLRPLMESPTNFAKLNQNTLAKVEKISPQTERKLSNTESTTENKNESYLTNKQNNTANNLNLTSNQSITKIEPKQINDTVETQNKTSEISIIHQSETDTTNQVIIENKVIVANAKPIENLDKYKIETGIDELELKPKNKNSWLLAAAYGSGSTNANSLLGSSDMLFDKGMESLVSATTTYNSILTPSDFTNIVHSPPVSFGLIIRKNLNENWSLESGLLYTYLLSTYDNQGTQRSDAKLHLHYIGIPINLVARVWRNSKWEINLASGCTFEKGLLSNYIQNQYFGNQTYTTTVKQNIDGFQWSLNASMGATYKLQQKIGIYFEPKLSYYLNNNQPMSARTEHPLIIGFNAGLRFEL
jgi:hypothetical protein